MKHLITTAAYSLLFMSAAALPEHKAGKKVYPAGTPSMFLVDMNKDGFIDRYEDQQEPSVSAIFNGLDKNHDGKLSEQEYRPEYSD
jgi:hypothetical protein